MALRVWLPLNGNLENKGISDLKLVSGSPSYKTGKISSQALNLNNRITFDCAELANLQTLSVCFWGMAENSSTLTSNWQDLLGFSDVSSSGTGGTFRWETTYASTNGIHWHDNATNAFVNGSHTHIAQKGIWCHCCVVFDYEKGKIFTYTNGELVNTHNHLGGKFNSTGRFYLGETNNIEGRINDVRFYDHALSALEVKEISQGLILHYKLDGFSGGVGENLISNSAPKDLSGWSSAGSGWSNSLVDCAISPTGKAVRNTYTGTTATSGGIHKPPINYSELDNGEIYTFSAYLRASKSCQITLKNEMMTSITSGTVNPTLTTQWQRYEVSGPINTSATYHSDVMYVVAAAAEQNMWIEACMIKLEKGTGASAWSLTPAEMNIDTTKIKDSSGYENDGIINGNIVTKTNNSNEGRYSIYTQFNGSNTYINAGKNAKVKDEITVAWWGYMDTWSSYTRAISCTEGGGWNFEPSSGKLNFVMGTGATSNTYKSCTSNTTLASLSSGWHHFVGTYNGLDSKLYIDGILDKTLNCYTTKTPIFYNANNNIIIGAEANGGAGVAGSYYNGKLSDIRIYATALSAEDILDLYHTPANIDNLGGIHGFEFIEKTPNLLNPDLREWAKESNVTCIWNEETKYFDVNTNRDTSNTSRWGIFQDVALKPNTSYLFVVDMMGTGSAMGIVGQDATTISWPNDRNTAGDTKRYYYILTTSATNTKGRAYLNIKPSINQIAHFKNIYLGEVGEIASIKQSGIFENEDMVEYNENGRITKSGELAGSNFIEK